MTASVAADRSYSEPIIKAYERESTIRVNAVDDTGETRPTGLADRLLAEQASPQADVFWSNEPVRTLVLKSRRALARYLLSADVERKLAESEAVQIPLHADVLGPKNLPAIGSFKPMKLDYAKAAERLDDVTARLQRILGL